MFGVANQVLTKRKMSQFLDMPHNVHSEWLLSDHKVKGAMKTGTTGRKIGPMRMMTGFHEDGQPVSLKMIVSDQRTHLRHPHMLHTIRIGRSAGDERAGTTS